MPVTTSVQTSSDSELNALLYPVKWGVSAFTFGFPSAAESYDGYSPGDEPFNAFEALNALQRTAARSAFGAFSAVANLTFTELSDAAAGTADFRLASSDAPSTAWAYLPTQDPRGGDAWFNNSRGRFDSPTAGNYAWISFLHELGHALGLKHPHESEGGAFGTMSVAHDSSEYTVMSYRSWAGQTGTGYANEAFGFAQTPMMYDIAALQYLYGANFAHRSGDDVYAWDPATGELRINGAGQGAPGANRIFMTLWDGGGADTYDFALYAQDLVINLAPGAWTTTAPGQRATLAFGHQAAGNIANALLYGGDLRSLIENATGGAGNDAILGNQAANRLEGGAGHDTLDGAAGADTLIGGTGNDIYLVDVSGDQAVELPGEGVDEVRTAAGSRTDYLSLYVLPANVEILTGTAAGAQGAYANALANQVTTGAGGDLLVLSDGGDDRVESGEGNDFLYFGGAFTNADRIDGGAGTDTLGLTGSYTLVFDSDDLVGIERLALYSSGDAGSPNAYAITTVDANAAAGQTLTVVAQSLQSDETLHFDGAAETGARFDLKGGRGADSLRGGAGDDMIWASGGADTLEGGAGQDSFVYQSAAESGPNAPDRILDFEPGTDRIVLLAIDSDANPANGDSGFTYVGANAFSAIPGELRLVQDATDPRAWRIEADLDGDTTPDFVLLLFTATNQPPAPNDFLF
ncbi:MAG TPA: M10 family metallopeptidase C-terminal domain-containing protein [Allosphingosinicella sp.]|jgi:serralysin